MMPSGMMKKIASSNVIGISISARLRRRLPA